MFDLNPILKLRKEQVYGKSYAPPYKIKKR